MNNYVNKMYRETALRKLAELLERARFWISNSDTTVLGIRRLALFGSLAQGKERAGDIDLILVTDWANLRAGMVALDETEPSLISDSYEEFLDSYLGLTVRRKLGRPVPDYSGDLYRYLRGSDGRIHIQDTDHPLYSLAGSLCWIDLIRNNQVLWDGVGELPEQKRASKSMHSRVLARWHGQIFPRKYLDESFVVRTLSCMPGEVRSSVLSRRDDLRDIWSRHLDTPESMARMA